MGHQKGGRPYKEKCARAQRNKRLYISKSILEKCQKSYENIPSEKGILYQMNRSTQNLLEYTKIRKESAIENSFRFFAYTEKRASLNHLI